MSLTLFSYPGDFRALKTLIAAQYNGVQIERPNFELGKDNLTPEFLAKNPLGKVPVLETPQGVIFESNAIARFVARIRRDTELLGRNFFESAQVDAWVDFTSHEVEVPVTMWVYPILGYLEFKKEVHDKAVADTHKALAVLEKHLLSRTFLVGESITLADIVLTAALFYPFKMVFDGSVRAKYPSVTRWFHTLVNQANVKAVLGDVPFAETALTASGAPAKAAGKKDEEKKEKKEKPKKEEKPKEEKKPAKKVEEEAPEEEEVAREAPKNDPFASLPKSSFVLDEWKRTYSNSRADWYASMPWFWENLDKDGWTLWQQKYKFNHENNRDFMTSNLVGGFIQRCDEVRRYAFGMMHVMNTKAPYEVEGVWLMRGTDVQAMLECNPDAEYYEWTKLDPTNDAHKQLVAECWCTSDKYQNKEIYDSKVFK